eukprot:11349334-Heterocapsa_arctica.AAC.1
MRPRKSRGSAAFHCVAGTKLGSLLKTEGFEAPRKGLRAFGPSSFLKYFKVRKGLVPHNPYANALGGGSYGTSWCALRVAGELARLREPVPDDAAAWG